MKVVSGSQTVEYGYDAEDKRVGTKLNGVTTEKYVYDGADIALVLNAAGTLVERYLFGDGTDNVLSRERSGAVVWSLGDRQGSVVDLVNQDGTVLNHFVYDGFGTRTGTTAVDFRYGYTGRELDVETGLYYYRARYYDSKVGRFISEDPIGFSAGDTNLYRYVGNNSTNYTDPTGTLISGWAEDLLLGADQLAAGFANVVSFGLTNKIRSTNKLAVENQEGWLYNLGSLAGLGVSAALNPLGAGANWARGAAAAYQIASTGYGALESVGNILSGQGTGWDALNLLPFVALPVALYIGSKAFQRSRAGSAAIIDADAVKRAAVNEAVSLGVAESRQALEGSGFADIGGRIFNPSRLLPPPVNPLSLNSRSILQSAIEDSRVSIGIATKAEIKYVELLRRQALQDLQAFYNVSPGQQGYGKIKGIDNPRSGSRNFAFASGNINGNKIAVIKAFSGVENVGEFAQLRQVRILPTSIVDNVDRFHDSEVKILEQILAMTNELDKGNIRLYTERVTCRSCGNAIREFLYTHRPGIDIEIVGGSRPGGLGN
jgi:RHS repeat-associated protein